jgi:hypothetical protein
MAIKHYFATAFKENDVIKYPALATTLKKNFNKWQR